MNKNTEESSSRSTLIPSPRMFPPRIGAYLLAVVRSRLYWGLLLFAIVPILMEAAHLNVVIGMLVYFSFFWFFVFRPHVATRHPHRSITADIIAYAFTAIVGTSFAIFVESFWITNGAGQLLQSGDITVTISSFILFVGITEEIAKQLIILIGILFVRWHRSMIRPVEFMIKGISSGPEFLAPKTFRTSRRDLWMKSFATWSA